MEGKIKYYNISRGYGFILGEDEEDYFFHIKGCIGDVRPVVGRKVEFEPTFAERGPLAVNVKGASNG